MVRAAQHDGVNSYTKLGTVWKPCCCTLSHLGHCMLSHHAMPFSSTTLLCFHPKKWYNYQSAMQTAKHYLQLALRARVYLEHGMWAVC